jgi:hypothetical protein
MAPEKPQEPEKAPEFDLKSVRRSRDWAESIGDFVEDVFNNLFD